MAIYQRSYKLSSYSEDKVLRRLYERLFRYDRESRMKIKRSEEYEVLEAVFDKPTLLTLYSMMNAGILDYLNGVVSTGKEARVYWGVKDGQDLAVKIYYTVTSSFKKRLAYMIGDPRFKAFKRTSRGLTEVWAKKEYKNLKQAYEAGISVPKPIAVKKNVLVMTFIGKDGKPAPLLAESEVEQEDYDTIISMIKRLYKDANIVHADLSEYNIFKYEGRIIFFDFGSGVDVSHPEAAEFLMRDINNINRFFLKRGLKVKNAAGIFEEVVG